MALHLRKNATEESRGLLLCGVEWVFEGLFHRLSAAYQGTT